MGMKADEGLYERGAALRSEVPGPERLKQRVLVLLGVIFGSNRLDDAEQWFAAALRLGCSSDDLEEFLLSAGAYCGELCYARGRRALQAALQSRGV